MPSTYAHYRMGCEVVERLCGSEEKIVSEYRELFDIGLHGPDILFYYGALSSNSVNAVGYDLHEKSGAFYFENARKQIRNSENGKASRAYAYGALCHFALDVTCHPYVEEKTSEGLVSHSEIEVEFDRMLMIEDGLNPVKHVLTKHIHPKEKWAKVIAPFYPGVSSKQVNQSLKSMIFLNKVLLAKNPLKRNMIYSVLRLTGNYEGMHGMIVNEEGNPDCIDSNKKLYALYNQAIPLAEKMIFKFEEYLNGEKELDSIFDFNFEGEKVQ